MNIKQLMEARDKASSEYRKLIKGLEKDNKKPDADERAKMDAIVDDITRFDEQIREEHGNLETRFQGMEDALNKLDEELKNLPAGQRDINNGGDEGASEPVKRFAEWLRTNSKVLAEESRAMSSSTGASGGYLVPDKFHKELMEYHADLCPLYELATRSEWDADAVFPVISGFGTTELVAEGSGASGTNPTAAQKNLTGYQFIYMVDVPWPLIRKAAYAIEGKLPGWWAKSNAGKMEDYFAVGTGSSQPKGIVVGATDGTDTASASALAGDDILNWYYDLKASYRKRSSWIFADSTIALIRKMKNPVTTSGALNYLWMPGLAGQPDTLLSRPIYGSDGMPAFAADTEIGVFGDISEYQIVEFGKPALIQDELSRASYGQTRFVGYRLMDADLPVAEAVISCPVKAV